MVAGPRAAEALPRGPRSLRLPALVPHPSFGRTRHTVHVGQLGILLQCQDLFLSHHVTGLHGLLEITDTGQSVICIVILIPDKPAAFGKRLDQLRTGGLLQFPGIIKGKTLEAPQLITFDHI